MEHVGSIAGFGKTALENFHIGSRKLIHRTEQNEGRGGGHAGAHAPIPPQRAALSVQGWNRQSCAVSVRRSRGLLHRAVETDALLPTDDQGEIDLILNALYLAAVNQGDEQELADAPAAHGRR